MADSMDTEITAVNGSVEDHEDSPSIPLANGAGDSADINNMPTKQDTSQVELPESDRDTSLNTTQNTSQMVDSYIDHLLSDLQTEEQKDSVALDDNKTSHDASNGNASETEADNEQVLVVPEEDLPITPDNIKEPEDSEDVENIPESSEEQRATETEEDDGWIFVLGHDKLKKKTVVPGAGITTRPTRGQLVTLSYSARLVDGTEVDKHQRHTFPLGEEDVIPALDLCIALMELNEVCEVYTEPQYAYGSKGREPDIPPDACLTYTVELLVVENAPDFSTLPVSLRVTEADKRRLRGNELYSRNEYSASINAYTRALEILDDKKESQSGSAEELQSLLDTRLKCYNNLAAAQLKVEAWEAAIKSCDEVIKIQPENVKALFRKGKCLAGKGELESAISLLRKALKLEPETKIIHQELSKLVFKFKAQENSTRAMYQKMLGTDKESAKPKTRDEKSYWWMVMGGATVAALLSAGIAAYRHFHV